MPVNRFLGTAAVTRGGGDTGVGVVIFGYMHKHIFGYMQV
jgi:hypothetical protein